MWKKRFKEESIDNESTATSKKMKSFKVFNQGMFKQIKMFSDTYYTSKTDNRYLSKANDKIILNSSPIICNFFGLSMNNDKFPDPPIYNLKIPTSYSNMNTNDKTCNQNFKV